MASELELAAMHQCLAWLTEERNGLKQSLESALQSNRDLEQQLAQALQLLKEELPYEANTGGYHAEEWSARVRALLAQHPQPS